MSASISFDHQQPERRISSRTRVQMASQLRLYNHTVSANILDLSTDGMAIRASESLQSDYLIDVSFVLPYTEQPIACEAKVIWSDGRGHAGIQFRNMKETSERAVREWLTQYIAVPH